MNVHMILEQFRASGISVFRTGDMARLLGMSKGSASVYIHRMKRMGLIHGVERGKFTITEDPFIVASQIIVPSYISFSTALYLHGRLDQVIDTIEMVTSRKREALLFSQMRIKFRRFPAGRVFGYRKHAKGNSFIMLGDLEKVAMDCLYKPRFVPISALHEALVQGFDKTLLERYALLMKSEAVVRRAGFLLESLGEDTELAPSTGTTYMLNPSLRRKGKYDKRWKLYVNEVFT